LHLRAASAVSWLDLANSPLPPFTALHPDGAFVDFAALRCGCANDRFRETAKLIGTF
jgi:hypothetical protein